MARSCSDGSVGAPRNGFTAGGVLRMLGVYGRTLRHLKPSQIAWRAWYMIRRRLRLYPRIPMPHAAPGFDPSVLESLHALMAAWARHDPPPGAAVDALREGQITFLNHGESVRGAFPWTRGDLPRLWRYHLHYFEYARTLALANVAEPVPGDRERVLAWVRDWIENNPLGADVAWDAFPIAARLMNWALAESVFHFDDPGMRRSFQQQAAYLRRSLEWDSLANHLLRDAVGLCVAEALLGGAARAGALLESQVREQVLPDGGHYERSPMYHCQVMQDLLIAHAAMKQAPAYLQETLARMAAFLEALLHPDGDLPLFGDCALGAYEPRALIALARAFANVGAAPQPAACPAFQDSGFYVLSGDDESSRMILKAGLPGPPYQLAHAHCDAAGYELSIGGKRILVDSGVHGYAESPLRAYCRGARAHNIAVVNGVEPMECWATFRVGRRAHAVVECWRPESREFRAMLQGQGIVQQRSVRFSELGCWVVCDFARGRGDLRLESLVHFHPGCEVREVEGAWVAEREGARLGLVPLHGVTGVLSRAWYCPEFGRSEAAAVLTLRQDSRSLVRIVYAIFPHGLPVDYQERAGQLKVPPTMETC